MSTEVLRFPKAYVTYTWQDEATTTVTETTYTFSTTTTVELPTPTCTEIGKNPYKLLKLDFANKRHSPCNHHNDYVFHPFLFFPELHANTSRTPSPCTVCHGATVVKSTVTAPTPTRTRTTRTWVTVSTTKTISIV